MRTQTGKFTLSGDGLCIGRDSGDAVSEDYKSPGTFKGGKILFVGVTVEKKQYIELEARRGGACGGLSQADSTAPMATARGARGSGPAAFFLLQAHRKYAAVRGARWKK